MSLPYRLALVPEKVKVAHSDLTKVAAALSKQVDQDFRSVWSVQATIDAFARLEDVPTDYWPIILVDDVQGAAGYHEDQNGQPYALVELGDEWSLTASHEMLEMLADPFGRRLKSGNLLDQAVHAGVKPGRVNYLVEACDPCESAEYAYTVNGFLVSDFYTPIFFDPKKAVGSRYSFTGAIDEPRKVLKDGYISWHDPITKHWMQLRMFPDDLSSKVPHVVDLTTETAFESLRTTNNLRAAIDRVTPHPRYGRGLQGDALEQVQRRADAATRAQAAHAVAMRTVLPGAATAPERPARPSLPGVRAVQPGVPAPPERPARPSLPGTRAVQLREEIKAHATPKAGTGAAGDDAGAAKRRPGESPNAYVERRSRDIERKPSRKK